MARVVPSRSSCFSKNRTDRKVSKTWVPTVSGTSRDGPEASAMATALLVVPKSMPT
jgi:hypothetical protein